MTGENRTSLTERARQIYDFVSSRAEANEREGRVPTTSSPS